MSWKSTDQANSVDPTVIVGLNKTANSTNVTALYGNATANAYVTGQTVGVFAVDSTEIEVDGGKVAHTGWVIRRVGQGGRAGRVQVEVLSAMGISTDSANGADDTVFPNS